MTQRLSALLLLCLLLAMPGCKPPPSVEEPEEPGDYESAEKVLSTDYTTAFPLTRTNTATGKTWTILGIMTDGHNFDTAKSNAEDTLTNHPDIAAMVGLWAYNTPKILDAVRTVGKTSEVHIIGFDEDPDTLQGIEDGEVDGTIVQQPYAFGFRCVEYLSALVRGQKVDVPEDKLKFIPTMVITRDNIGEFKNQVEAMRAGKGPVLEHPEYDTTERVRVAFITNSVDPFWELAQQGCQLAAKEFNADVRVLMPPTGQVEEQKRYLEEELVRGTQGLAISPIDPANQTEIINAACKQAKVITQDSDAPDSDRLFYLGTDNYTAGRQAGELIDKVCPDGGKVMVFVGKMEVMNAQERSQGLIDVLLGQD